MPEKDIVELLQGAGTLRQAFELLRLNQINFSILKVNSEDTRILLPKFDYVIISSSAYGSVLHPYGTDILYQPIFPKKP